MARETTRWRKFSIGDRAFKKCGYCKTANQWKFRVCRNCGRRFVSAPKKERPARGTPERLALELAHARTMADRWTTKVMSASKTLHGWHVRAKRLQAQIAAGPKPPRPKKVTPIRGINLESKL